MPSFRIDVTVCIGQERLSGSVSTYTGTQFFQVWATMATGTIVADDDKAFCIFRAQRHCFMFFFENVFSLSLSLSTYTTIFSSSMSHITQLCHYPYAAPRYLTVKAHDNNLGCIA